MSEEKDLQEQIENYLAGAMDAATKTAFERQLETDPDLAQALLLNQEVHRTVKDSKALALEESLRGIGEEFASQFEAEKEVAKNHTPLIKRYRWIAAVAAILLCGLFAWWLWNNNSSSLFPQKLYADFYKAYPAQTHIRSLDNSKETTYLQAQKAYQAKDYPTAIQSFKLLLEEENLSPEFRINLLFYKGQAHLAAQEIAAARQLLEPVIAEPTHNYTRQTQWYLALIALQSNELEQARAYLLEAQKGIAQGKYYQQAKDLYQKIE